MEADDVLPEDLVVGGPDCGKSSSGHGGGGRSGGGGGGRRGGCKDLVEVNAERPTSELIKVPTGSDVVCQGIDPDVDRMIWVVRDRDAPFDRLAGNRNVVEASFHEGTHFFPAKLRNDALGVGLQPLQELVLKGGKAKLVIFFLDPNDWAI
jgi:hypothetical protein